MQTLRCHRYTSLHHNGATARSSVGTEADVELMEDLYIEDWWIKALAERDEWHGIWHRNFFTVSLFDSSFVMS